MTEADAPARGFGLPSISRSLQILAVALLVAIAGVTTQQLLQARAGLVADAARQMARLDMVFAEQAGRAVETVDLILRNAIEALQSAGGLHAVDRSATNDLLRRRIEGVRQVNEVAIVSRDGATLFTSRPGPPGQLPAAGRALLAQYVADPHVADPRGGLLLSEPFRGPDERWSALMTRPILDRDGQLAGMAVAYLNLSYFQDFYQAVELDEGGAILLHRRDGTVLARYPPDDKLVGTSFADLPPFKDILSHGIAGTVLMDSPVDGSRRVLAIRALKAFPLAVNVSVDLDRVLAGWRRQAWMLVGATGGAGLLLGALMLALAQRSRQVEALAGEFRAARDAAQAANAGLREQIEERERAEAALRQAQRIEALGQLTGGLAHDFNNLLTVVLGNVDLVQRIARLEGDAASRLATIRSAAERGARLTSQLLAFARRQPLVPRAVDLNNLVGGMSALLQSALSSPVRLEARLGEGVWLALVDPTQLELVVLNLALNGRDAMPQGGTLSIATGNFRLGPPEREDDPPAGDYVRISVSDDGSGMPPAVLARAFEPFFTTKPPGAGSGLGLSQVFGVANQSGGGVKIDTAPGRGTTVHVFLPRAAAGAVSAPPPPTAVPVSRTGQARVLVVDDDEDVRATTATLLRTFGYVVHEACGGPAALDIIRSETGLDVLLTDMAMPEMTGPELARQAAVLRPALPVVFVTGYADPESIAAGTRITRLLRKPFRPADLVTQIEAAMAGTEQAVE